MPYMTTSDRLLLALKNWVGLQDEMEDMPLLIRDQDEPKEDLFAVTFNADEPQDHEVLRGVEEMSGEVCLEALAKDTTVEERRELLGLLAEFLQADELVSWLSSASEERGLGELELRVYEFLLDGAHWETEDLVHRGILRWSAVAAPCA